MRIPLVLLAMIIAVSGHARAGQPVEFELSTTQSSRILTVLNDAYAKLKSLPDGEARSSNKNSFDSKSRWIDGRYASVTVDSCSEENGSCIYFSFSNSDAKGEQYPMDVVRFVYNPISRIGYIAMYTIPDHLSPYRYERNKRKVREAFMQWLARIDEFI